MAQPESPWPKRRRQPDPAFEEKRDAVLAAAARLFVERGYENTSLNELASVLNVTKPTLYYYFESKEQILHEIIERSQRMNSDAFARALRSPASGRERLRMACEQYARLLTDDFGKCQVKVNWRALPEGIREDLRAKLVETDSVLRKLLAEGIDDGSIAPCDVKLATFTIFGALNWMANWHREDGALDAPTIAGRMVDLLFRGFDPR